MSRNVLTDDPLNSIAEGARSAEAAGSRQRVSPRSTPTRPTASAIYEGSVRHRRNEPHVHQFDFKFFMLMIDLDEIDSVFKHQPFWSTKRWSICRLKRSDHLKKHAVEPSLRRRASLELAAHGITAPIGSIGLLTQLSYLGFRMNPVSFYYCYDPTHTRLVAIIAEVNNTPWGEQHIYVVQGNQVETSDTVRSEPIKKEFHVSPFFDLNMNYRMAFSPPANRLAVKIENHAIQTDTKKRKLNDVTLKLKRYRLTTFRLNGLLVRYPLMSFRVFAGIYWQAIRLYWKKIPVVPHPSKHGSPNE